MNPKTQSQIQITSEENERKKQVEIQSKEIKRKGINNNRNTIQSWIMTISIKPLTLLLRLFS